MKATDTTVINQYGISLYIPNNVVAKEGNNIFLRYLIVTKVGYYSNAKGHFIERDGIDEYVMLYCVDGKGWVRTGHRKSKIKKGDLVVCDINYPHAYGADAIDPWSIHWAHFKGDGVPELLKLLGLSKQSAKLTIGEKTQAISLISEACKTLSKGYSFPYLFYASTCLQKFFCYVIKLKMHMETQNTDSCDMEEIIRFMLENINTTFSLNQFAHRAKISKYHFARKFKQKTGYSPIDYFNRLKIQKACELIDTSSLTIKEISDTLGFNNPFYFSEVFKRITGMSPKKYRYLQGG